ncbi:MAG TPA: ATP-binding cassette domain-containing protein [Actinopolymorphaceae bacterium]
MIQANGLTKAYGDTIAVDDLSFEVRPGVVTGFLGPNGAGKSTTMRLMLELDHGGGEALFDGRRFSDIRHPMREVGTVLEAKAFHPKRSARNHLRMLAAANRISTRRVDEVLAMVGLADVARKSPGGFSFGMGQRLGLAAALLGDPGTLILDEPSNGLDPHGIQWLRDLLKKLAAEGRTIFVSSHLLAEMALMADDLVVIGRGRLISAGPAADFIRDFTRSSVVVRSPDSDVLVKAVLETLPAVEVSTAADGSVRFGGVEAATVGEVAARVGAVLHELTSSTASLEEAFLQATGASEEYVGTVLPASSSVAPAESGGPA